MPQRPTSRGYRSQMWCRPKVAWADLCVVSVTLPQERRSQRNPFRDSDVVLGRIGTDVADARAWIAANAGDRLPNLEKIAGGELASVDPAAQSGIGEIGSEGV